MEICLRELKHPGLFKNYRVCPNCHGKFTPDTRTKHRQAIFIIVSIISLVLTMLLYFKGTEWLFPSIISYVIFVLLIYWGNKHIFLVPYQSEQDTSNDT
jgi:hypothetical protein